MREVVLRLITSTPQSLVEIVAQGRYSKPATGVELRALLDEKKVWRKKRMSGGQKCYMWELYDEEKAAVKAGSLSIADCVMSRLWNSDVFAAT